MTDPTGTRDARVEQPLDPATIVRMVQGVSGEIVLEKLMEKVLVLALEHAGVSRGLFVLSQDGAPRVAAEGTVAVRGTATVRLHDDVVPPVAPPDAVLDAVARTREPVVLHDVAAREPLASDRALFERHVRSILCVPLTTAGELLGALYFEDPTPRAFTPARIEMLQLLAAQAAISLRHAHLLAEVRRTEQQVRRRAQELELIIDGVPVLIWRARSDGSIDFLNRRWIDFLGIADSIPRGSDPSFDWTTHIHPDDLGGVLAHWNTHLSSGEAYEHVSRMHRSDGQYRWHMARGFPHRDDTGAIVGWYGISVDIQDLTEAQEKIRQQDRELRTLLEIVPQKIFVLGSDLRFEYANKAVLDYLGEALQEVLLAHDLDIWPMIFHPDDMPRVRAALRGLAEGIGSEVEARMRRWDGEYRWHLSHSAALRDDEGRIIRWYNTATDIDDRKKADDQVRQQEGELRKIVELASHHTAVVAADGTPLYSNQAMQDYYAMTNEELRASMADPRQRFRRIAHPEDVETFLAAWERGFAGTAPLETEARFRRRDGEYRWFLVRSVPLRDDGGRIVRWYVTGTDIDDRKNAEERAHQETLALREELDNLSMFEEIVGKSRALRAVLANVARVAPTDSTVLITGETGTGKELVARAIHKGSARSSHPFVTVNCAAIPPALIASELFGHEKGAFTGALQRRLGRFELADRGTIFLDEVGDLPSDIQLALLRVLQEREFERVGGTRSIRVDVRVIAATNRDLHAAMAADAFRSDLFYRLNVFPIEMPPLRERAADIPLLVAYFVDRYASQAGKTIRHVDERTLDLIRSYRWPGNVRELQNVIERAVIICESDTLTVDPSWLSRETAPAPLRPLVDELAARERQIIEATLAESSGRISGPKGAAVKLGIPASTLESKIRALGIGKHRFKSP